MSSGAAFRTSAAAFMHIRVAFAAQSRRSSGNGFRSAASFLKTCTLYTATVLVISLITEYVSRCYEIRILCS